MHAFARAMEVIWAEAYAQGFPSNIASLGDLIADGLRARRHRGHGPVKIIA